MQIILRYFTLFGVIALFSVVGCSTTKAVEKKAVEVKATEKMDLEKCPCGRSAWDQLPPGAIKEKSKEKSK